MSTDPAYTGIVALFKAVGTSRPLELDPAAQTLLFNELERWNRHEALTRGRKPAQARARRRAARHAAAVRRSSSAAAGNRHHAPKTGRVRYLLVNTIRGVLPISEDEARELASRLRDLDPGPLPSDFTAAAIHIERALETPAGQPSVSMNRAENEAVYAVIRDWLRHVPAAQLGARLMNLRSALLAEPDVGRHNPPSPAA